MELSLLVLLALAGAAGVALLLKRLEARRQAQRRGERRRRNLGYARAFAWLYGNRSLKRLPYFPPEPVREARHDPEEPPPASARAKAKPARRPRQPDRKRPPRRPASPRPRAPRP